MSNKLQNVKTVKQLLDGTHRTQTRKSTYFSQSKKSIPNKLYPKQDKGDIIVFPSWATHAIDASYGKERFTIAGNIAFNSVHIAETGTQYNNTKVRENLYILEKLNGSN